MDFRELNSFLETLLSLKCVIFSWHIHFDIVFPRFIHSTNRKGLTYKVQVNHLADQTQEELRKLRGRKKTDGKYNGGMEFKSTVHPKEIPASMNWRLYGKKTVLFFIRKLFITGVSK